MDADRFDVSAVCFDMDGVLVDSEDYWVPLEREYIFAEAVAEPVDVAEITGMNVEDCYDYLREEYTLQVDRDRFLALYDEVGERIYTEHAALMPDFDDVLAAARTHGQTGLVTSSPTHWVGWVFDRFGIRDRSGVVSQAETGHAPDDDADGDTDGDTDAVAAVEDVRAFDVVASADEVDRGKPAPDVYRLAAERLAVDPGRCLAIEDSTNGVRAANAAGMTVVAYGDPPDAAATEADAVAASSDELLEYVRGC